MKNLVHMRAWRVLRRGVGCVLWRTLRRALRCVWIFVVDTIAPRDPLIRIIEELGEVGFPAPFRGLGGLGGSGKSGSLKDVEMAGIFSGPLMADFVWLYSYKDPLIKNALVEIKDRPNKMIARILGRRLFDGLVLWTQKMKGAQKSNRYIVIPIPITRAKKRKRGWNQCELVLDAFQKFDVAQRFDVRFDVLVKSHETVDQVGKSASERRKNIEGSFAVHDYADIFEKDIILFDDILTTGATLREARSVLVRGGARSVVCVAFAH